jgi:DNA-binding IclR family transcriptional regulator
MVWKTSPAAMEVAGLLQKEEMGVRQIIRETGKSQSVVYRTLDKLVEAGRVRHDPETKKYSWVGPVEPVSPFEGGEK